ncbi:hypothetical protein [Chromobacterium amazonense]|uniref:hypothetical protein n=1 Tax=Chromobacterium amazonense TaxID=1382803 RepID=UPI001B80AAA1|nr:hypothetical protein [Chromobacterium amazonense]
MERLDVAAWCAIQLGDQKYTRTLQALINHLVDTSVDHESKSAKEKTDQLLKKLNELKLNEKFHYSNEELNIKASTGGGGYASIGFIEERYADLIRLRKGNDGTHYKSQLSNHINYVKRKAHSQASEIFNQLKFSGTVQNCFDTLKTAADDKLLDLNPELAEQLMLAFKAVASTKSEEWSQALTTCRRLIEGLADTLYPPSDQKQNGRALGPTNYVNRLWAFMDKSIASNSNKELAKTHIDFLGSWLEKVNKISNKGVHAEVSQIEATKAVFHTYLIVADILECATESPPGSVKKSINEATLDEIEAQLDVSRAIAKEIFKARVRQGKLNTASLSSIKGVGPKAIRLAHEAFDIPE